MGATDPKKAAQDDRADFAASIDATPCTAPMARIRPPWKSAISSAAERLLALRPMPRVNLLDLDIAH